MSDIATTAWNHRVRQSEPRITPSTRPEAFPIFEDADCFSRILSETGRGRYFLAANNETLSPVPERECNLCASSAS